VWSQETAAGLFSVSGGTGASISTPTITTNVDGTVTLTCGSANATLTITDNSTGATDTFDVSGAATAYTLTAPSPAKGDVQVDSEDFTVEPNGSLGSVGDPVTITPDGAQGGTFTPSALTWTGESSAKTFTFKPVLATVNHTISVTNDGGLSDPPDVNYLGMVQLGSSGTGTDTGSGGGNFTPSLGGVDLLANGPWLQEMKRDIRSDDVDPYSDTILAAWRAVDPGVHVLIAATGAGTGGNGANGSIPFNIVPGDQPALVTNLGAYASESDPSPYQVDPFGSYESIPPEDVPPDSNPGGQDQHWCGLVRNETTGGVDLCEELYKAYTLDGGVTMETPGGARFDLTTGYPRFDSWTSTDAAGLPIIPLLVKYEEAERGDIGHAIRITVPAASLISRYEYPGRHYASGFIPNDGTPGLLFGGRLRIKDSWYQANKTRFTGHARAIVDGLWKYGGIIADITGGGYSFGPFICGAADDRWDSTLFGQLHHDVPITAFEVVKRRKNWELLGPTTGDVGVSHEFTINRIPINDQNYNVNIYLSLNGGSPDPHFSVSQLAFTEPGGDATGTFTFTPPEEGIYLIGGADGNAQYQYVPPIVFTTTGYVPPSDDHGARMRRLLRP
jgi:hypothetical protein